MTTRIARISSLTLASICLAGCRVHSFIHPATKMWRMEITNRADRSLTVILEPDTEPHIMPPGSIFSFSFYNGLGENDMRRNIRAFGPGGPGGGPIRTPETCLEVEPQRYHYGLQESHDDPARIDLHCADDAVTIEVDPNSNIVALRPG